MRAALVALPILTVFAAACGSSANDGRDTEPPVTDDGAVASPDTQGDWFVDELRVDGRSIGISPSHPVTMTIDGSQVAGVAACNQYGGAIDVADTSPGRFVVTDLSWTEMGCEPAVMDVEQAFLSALQQVDAFEAIDGLSVSSSDDNTGFVLVREPNQPGRADR